jgi:hypothetical protein
MYWYMKNEKWRKNLVDFKNVLLITDYWKFIINIPLDMVIWATGVRPCVCSL